MSDTQNPTDSARETEAHAPTDLSRQRNQRVRRRRLIKAAVAGGDAVR